MSNEPNKPIPAQELTEKELEGVVGGGSHPSEIKIQSASVDYSTR